MRGALRGWLTMRNVFTVVLCLMIGSLGVYYAVFTLLLVVAAGLAAALDPGLAAIAEAAVVVAVIAGMSFINDLPGVIYQHEHGKNHLVAIACRRRASCMPLSSPRWSFRSRIIGFRRCGTCATSTTAPLRCRARMASNRLESSRPSACFGCSAWRSPSWRESAAAQIG